MPELKLEVRHVYETREGQRVKIIQAYESEAMTCSVGLLLGEHQRIVEYGPKGAPRWERDSTFSLVREVTE